MPGSPDKKKSALLTYRGLEVWQRAMDLAVEVYSLSRRFPEDERFGLISQIRSASVSVPSNIAEGYGRRDRGDYRRHLSIANGSLKEVETQLILAGRLGFITKSQASKSWALSQDVGKMLNRLLAALDSSGTRNPLKPLKPTPETRS